MSRKTKCKSTQDITTGHNKESLIHNGDNSKILKGNQRLTNVNHSEEDMGQQNPYVTKCCEIDMCPKANTRKCDNQIGSFKGCGIQICDDHAKVIYEYPNGQEINDQQTVMLNMAQNGGIQVVMPRRVNRIQSTNTQI